MTHFARRVSYVAAAVQQLALLIHSDSFIQRQIKGDKKSRFDVRQATTN